MRNVRMWLVAAVLLAVVAGATALINTSPSAGAAPPPANHWRYHDGHWSYWYEPDQRWYYTDGTNWFYHDNDAWKVYSFDRGWGREGFERGDWRAPGPDVRIVVPRHGIFRRR